MKKTIVLGAVAFGALAANAVAHGGATGVVKERMDGMLAMGKAVKSIAPMMQEQVQYDADAVRAAARSIKAHSGETLTKLFPEGSIGKPSEARPEIWRDWEGFAELADQLDTFASGLEIAAGNGVAAMSGMMNNSAMMSSSGMMSGSNMMGGAMMGSSNMMGGSMMTVEQIGTMPANAAFAMVSQACSTCHTRFRQEVK